jgi:tetratricopeptide (TPR) repeat protein
MNSLVARPRTVCVVSAWAVLHAVGCQRDAAATSGEPPHAARLADEVVAPRPHGAPEATFGGQLDQNSKDERALDTPQAIQRRGLALEASGHLDEALRLYEQALGQPGAPLEVLERKALVQSWLERFEESKASYRLVLNDPRSDEPGRRRARRKLAELLAWEGKLDEALADLQRLLDEEPGDCESRLLRGQILEWQGRYREAKVDYSKLLEVDAQHDEARRRLDKLLWVR